ncbi:MAG: hypothetical protein WA952_01015 [Lewinella sp.]
MVFLLLTFGDNSLVHQQATFSAMTLLARGEEEICIVTDTPRYYGLLKERVRIITISAAELKEWKGPQDNFLRTKIKAFQRVVAEYPQQHVVYVDADTFCFGDPKGLADTLNSGDNLLHALEGPLTELPTKSEKRMGKQTSGKTYGGVRVGHHHSMYNSGVVGIAADRAPAVIEMALTICDEMCAQGVEPRLIEQYSFSIALAEAGSIQTANSVIGHYWGNKREWNSKITEFYVTHHLLGNTLDEQVEAAGRLDFRAIPVYRKSRSKEAKLHAWLEERRNTTPRTFVPPAGETANKRSERWEARR